MRPQESLHLLFTAEMILEFTGACEQCIQYYCITGLIQCSHWYEMVGML